MVYKISGHLYFITRICKLKFLRQPHNLPHQTPLRTTPPSSPHSPQHRTTPIGFATFCPALGIFANSNRQLKFNNARHQLLFASSTIGRVKIHPITKSRPMKTRLHIQNGELIRWIKFFWSHIFCPASCIVPPAEARSHHTDEFA